MLLSYMGKPFLKELDIIDDTFKWAKSININDLGSDLLNTKKQVIVVGSGGSFAACHLLVASLQNKGIFAKAITPLELQYSAPIIHNSVVFFVSASGKNSDILFAYKTAVAANPHLIEGLCMTIGSKLKKQSAAHSISNIMELACPAGKDGFLATNSLIAYFTILSKIAGHTSLIKDLKLLSKAESDIKKFVSCLHPDFSITILYAGWGQPVAIDIESKFTEAGIGNILYADFRNFGHGRHNWFDKKKKQSAIVALVTPSEKNLAFKTLDLLPKFIPKLILETVHDGPDGSLDLLNQSFYLALEAGKKNGIDPGRPGVPPYGSKLYNLKYQTTLNTILPTPDDNAILIKTQMRSLSQIGDEKHKFWLRQLKRFRTGLSKQKFGALIMDYDGTLCTKEDRKNPASKEVIDRLTKLLAKGFVIGIVTGRGKSVRTALDAIPEKYRSQVVIGYYNGAVITTLEDQSAPVNDQKPHSELQEIYNQVNAFEFGDTKPRLELRPLQLTIENNSNTDWTLTKAIVIDIIHRLNPADILIRHSGHSIDIIVKSKVSKTRIIQPCLDLCRKLGKQAGFLAIGDKGKYPGNDYELLSSPYSLSVDETSPHPASCWNLSDPGLRGPAACMQYLDAIVPSMKHFTIRL